MTSIIIPSVVILIGLGVIGKGFYDYFFNSFVPNPKKWGRTRAKITGRHHYQKKNTSRHSTTPYRDCYEKSIVYTVDGVTYKKYVDDSENGSVHIYYKLKNPHVIRTVNSMKKAKREARRKISLVTMVVSGLIIIAIATPFLVTGIAKVTHTPIGNTYYV